MQQKNTQMDKIQTDNIKDHPIYKEAMQIYHKNIGKAVTRILAFLVFALFLLIANSHFSGKQCMKTCQDEGIIKNCNDYCY